MAGTLAMGAQAITSTGTLSAGAATLGNITSSTYNVPRWRGALVALPTTDLREGDMCQYYGNPSGGLYTYTDNAWWKYDQVEV